MSLEEAALEARNRFGPSTICREETEVRWHKGEAWRISVCFVGRIEKEHTLRELGRGPTWPMAIHNAQLAFQRGAS
jgi:hypothetical protein